MGVEVAMAHIIMNEIAEDLFKVEKSVSDWIEDRIYSVNEINNLLEMYTNVMVKYLNGTTTVNYTVQNGNVKLKQYNDYEMTKNATRHLELIDKWVWENAITILQRQLDETLDKLQVANLAGDTFEMELSKKRVKSIHNQITAIEGHIKSIY